MKLFCGFYIPAYKMCIIFDIFKYENAKEQKELRSDHLLKENKYLFCICSTHVVHVLGGLCPTQSRLRLVQAIQPCIFIWNMKSPSSLEHGKKRDTPRAKSFIPEIKLTTSHNLLHRIILPSRNRKIFSL